MQQLAGHAKGSTAASNDISTVGGVKPSHTPQFFKVQACHAIQCVAQTWKACSNKHSLNTTSGTSCPKLLETESPDICRHFKKSYRNKNPLLVSQLARSALAWITSVVHRITWARCFARSCKELETHHASAKWWSLANHPAVCSLHCASQKKSHTIGNHGKKTI